MKMATAVPSPRHIKCVVVGDSGVGKTGLIKTFIEDKFPTDLQPCTLHVDYEKSVVIGRRELQLRVYDTCASECDTTDQIRQMSYPGTDIFLVCCSVDDQTSLENVEKKWEPEIRHFYGRDAKIVLVATKTDLRDCSQSRRRQSRRQSDQSEQIRSSKVRDLCEKLQLLTYFEGSAAASLDFVKEVFDFAITEATGLKHDSRKKSTFASKCVQWLKKCCCKQDSLVGKGLRRL